MEAELVIAKKNYSDQVFDYLFEQITSKKLKPGDKLPNERQLSEALGISRPPLREALKALSSVGLLTTHHGGGTYVSDYGLEYIHTILKFLTVCNGDLMLDFVQLRAALESQAAYLAANNATEEDIQRLEDIHLARKSLVEAHSDHLDEVRGRLRELDLAFHNMIAQASGNRIFIEFLDAIRSTLTIQQKYAVKDMRMTEHSLQFHQDIIDAIKSHDGALAAKMMNEHIGSVENAIRKHFVE